MCSTIASILIYMGAEYETVLMLPEIKLDLVICNVINRYDVLFEPAGQLTGNVPIVAA